MSETVTRLKVEKLKQERELLERQIEAVSDESTRNTDSEKKPVLEFKLERLYDEFYQKAAEIAALETVLEETKDDAAKITGSPMRRVTKYDARTHHARPPQEVFPYLLDRSEQEERLVQSIVAHRREKPKRPFICILHGDELECHTLYLKRLKLRSLPEILSAWYPLEAESTPIEQFDIQVPLSTMTNAEYEQALWHNLRAATHGSKPVSQEDIINFVASHKLSVIIKSSLLTEDLKRVSFESIDRFFSFWERWPEVSPNLLLLVALSFKYQRNSKLKRHMIRNWSRTRLNRQIRQHLNDLDFSNHKEISGALLPELAAIRRSDAEALIRQEEVSVYSDIGDQDIRVLYGNQALCTQDGCIPMETLLDRLVQIYKEKQRYPSRRF